MIENIRKRITLALSQSFCRGSKVTLLALILGSSKNDAMARMEEELFLMYIL